MSPDGFRVKRHEQRARGAEVAEQPVRRARVVKPAADRERELLEAAQRVFERKGLAATTVGDITEAAGVAKGTFYLYFESKDHLLAALWARLLEGLQERIAATMGRVGDAGWMAAGEATVAELVRYDLEHRELYQMMYAAASGPAQQMFREITDRIRELVRAFVAQGAADGVFRVSNPLLAADLIHHAVDGLLVRVILEEPDGGPPAGEMELIAAINEMMRRTLGVPDP